MALVASLGAEGLGPYGARMEVHGTLEANLISAIGSAKRLRGHPVHPDTIAHWSDILHLARRVLAADQSPDRPGVMELVAELEAELADRGA